MSKRLFLCGLVLLVTVGLVSSKRANLDEDMLDIIDEPIIVGKRQPGNVEKPVQSSANKAVSFEEYPLEHKFENGAIWVERGKVKLGKDSNGKINSITVENADISDEKNTIKQEFED